MEITYTVNAKCNCMAGINVEFKGVSSIESAFKCATTLEEAFAIVDIICEQTGEVVYSRYFSTDFFVPTLEKGKAIFKAEFDMSV